MTAKERARIDAHSEEWQAFATMLVWRVYCVHFGGRSVTLLDDHQRPININAHQRDDILSAISRASEDA